MLSSEECSQEVLETIPLVMGAIRSEMRRQREPDLSVPQFRTLIFVYHNDGSSLSRAAEFVGLTLSAMSKLVDGLVARSLLARETSRDDRRRLLLALTPAGKAILLTTLQRAQKRLAEVMKELSESDCAAVIAAMRTLKGAFAAKGNMPREPD